MHVLKSNMHNTPDFYNLFDELAISFSIELLLFFFSNVISHEPFVGETTGCTFYVQNPRRNCNFRSDGNQDRYYCK